MTTVTSRLVGGHNRGGPHVVGTSSFFGISLTQAATKCSVPPREGLSSHALSGLVHLFFPAETEKRMSRSGNVRIVGAILLALILSAIVGGFYILAGLFRDLRPPPTICARPFHSSTTEVVSSQSAWSAVDNGRSWPVDCLQVGA
jgi:hypothetical protein